MIRLTLLILILFSLITGSCSSRKNKPDHSNLIPENELVSILTEIHLAGGLLTIPKIRSLYSSLDSISSYYLIFEKHGFSKEIMDKTIKYYFIKKPRELIKIYDQVLGTLSEMESINERKTVHAAMLWTGREFYSFPDPTVTDSTLFNFTLNIEGIYTFTFSTTLFPDDQSLNPRVTVYSCNPDSVETGKRKYIETINYIKDGQPHTYTLTLNVPANTTLHFRGWLFDFDNNPDKREKHVIIKNISVSNTPLAV